MSGQRPPDDVIRRQLVALRAGLRLEQSEYANPHRKMAAIARIKICANNVDLIARINAAIARLDAETYGSCLECKQEISYQRLAEILHAELCYSCQRALDEQQRPRPMIRRRAEPVHER